MGILDPRGQGLLETIELRIVFGIQTLFAHKPPKTLNQIQVRRMGRQKQQFDAQSGGMLQHQFAFLITRALSKAIVIVSRA